MMQRLQSGLILVLIFFMCIILVHTAERIHIHHALLRLLPFVQNCMLNIKQRLFLNIAKQPSTITSHERLQLFILEGNVHARHSYWGIIVLSESDLDVQPVDKLLLLSHSHPCGIGEHVFINFFIPPNIKPGRRTP